MEAPAPEAAATATAPAAVNEGPERNAEQIFSELSGSVARINVSNDHGERVSLGSGVVIGPDTVITNCHVTQNGRNIQVKVGESSLSAQLDVEDREFDLCSLRVSALRAPAVRIGSGQGLNSGQKVFAIGAPHGLDLTISDGIVSGLREVAGGKLIQTTAPVSPGSSGGGLFDTKGNLVGIVTFQHNAGQNLNFAVPAEWIKEMRNRSSSRGSVGAVTIRSPREAAPPEVAESRSVEHASEQKILGRWECRNALRGRSFELEFFKQGRLIVVRDGKVSSGGYVVGPKGLRIIGQDSLHGGLD